MADRNDKSLMRNLGEFFGHVFKGITTDPASKKTVIKKEVEEQKDENMTLRRTTIEEIEFKPPNKKADS